MTSTPVRITVMGTNGVGKSSMSMMFTNTEYYLEDYMFMIQDVFDRRVTIDDVVYDVTIFEADGYFDPFHMRANEDFVQLADGVVFAFAIDNQGSFDSLDKLFSEYNRVRARAQPGAPPPPQPPPQNRKNNAGGNAANAPKMIPGVLCGCKGDLSTSRTVPREAAEALAKKHGMPYIECSVKLKQKVDDVFYEVVRVARAAKAVNEEDN